MRKIIRSVAALSAAALLLAGCADSSKTASASQPPSDPKLAQLVQEAKAAGPVTFYSMIDQAALQKVSDAFTAKYGIQVKPVRLVTGDLTQRYSSEASTGKAAADIVLMTDSPFFDQALKSNWFAPVDKLGIPADGTGLPADYWEHGGQAPIVSLIPTDTVINTDEVKQKPTAWTDYAGASFKGKLLLAKPDSSPANVSFWSLMRQTYGDDFLRGIAANNPKWMSSAVPVTQGVAAGEGSVGHPGVAAVVNDLVDKGAPIQLVHLSPTTGPEAAIGISAHSPNQPGAELLAYYVMSKEGNTLLNDVTAAISPLSADAGKSFTRTKNIKTSSVAEIDSLLGVK